MRGATATAAGPLQLRTARAVGATVRLATPASGLVLRARGVACGGPASVSVAIDQHKVAKAVLRGARFQSVTVRKALTAGTHRIAVGLANAHAQRGCRREVWVDDIVVRTAPAAPAAPIAAPAASVPTAVPTPAPAPAEATQAPPTADTGAPEAVTAPAPTTATPPAQPSTPAPPVDTRAKLQWAPPALAAPTTINVAQGDQTYTLDTTKDYVINLGAVTHVGAVSISGGRNVVMIGGRIALTTLSTKATALNIKNSTGTVHVEGVAFDGTSGHEMDAIQIQAPAATVQVENVRADGLLGTFDTNHSDVIQPWGGVGRLRVDRLSADSNYQGIFTRPDQGAIGSVDLRHVDLTFNNAAAGSSGGYLLWMTTGCDMAPTALSDVYIAPRTGKSVGTAVWPPTSDPTCPARLSGTRVTWPTLPVTGAVLGGAPSGGAYVPAGSVGPGYTSPGYQ